jgi:DNA polymerase IV
MDEFFAAVEKLDNPSLRGKPILVGGDPNGRGVVATASYEARQFGCHSAMPMRKAIRLCPQAVIVHPHFERYSALSKQVFGILRQFTPLVEELSIDEAFLDVAGSRRLLGEPPRIAADIKKRIRAETGLTASVGVAYNKFLAKLASDLKKPDGLVVIVPEQMHEILDPLSVSKIWGVGPVACGQLERLNIRTIGQLRRASPGVLARTFGHDTAEHFMRLANGLDDRPVVTESQAKSVGQEETFAVDVDNPDALRATLRGQIEEVAQRLRSQHLRARTVTLKLRHGDFTTLTRSVTLPEPTHSTDELSRAARGVFDQWASGQFRPLRLLGTSASNLSGEHGQLSLFANPGQQKQQRVDQALDSINKRFGASAINRGKTKGR